MWFICNSNISNMGNLMVRIQGIPFQSIQQNLPWKLLTILKNILKKIYTHLIRSWNDFFLFLFFIVVKLWKIDLKIDRSYRKNYWISTSIFFFKFNEWRIRKIFVYIFFQQFWLVLDKFKYTRTPCISTYL